MDKLGEKLLAELSAKDELLLQLGDTLDVKASILLVLVTFLATLTASSLEKQPHGTILYLQYSSAFCLALAAIAAIVELWPCTFLLPYPEANTVSRIEELKQFFEKEHRPVESSILSELTGNQIEWTMTRIAKNQKLNDRKSWWLNIAFYITAAAIGLDIATLITKATSLF